MRNPIRRWNARRRYYQLADAAAELIDQLDRTTAHDQRYQLISRLAGYHFAMARACRAGWGAYPTVDGGNLSTSLHRAGVLLRLLCWAEHKIADPGFTGTWSVSWDVDRAAYPVLAAAVTAGSISRAVLTELADALEPLVGVDATLLVRNLPVPGDRPDCHLTA